MTLQAVEKFHRTRPDSAQTSRGYWDCERFIAVVDRPENRPVPSDRR
jgi:hypothetical protein